MRVLDLFSGLGGFSQPFRDRGHEVVTLDIEARFNPDIIANIRDIQYPCLSLDGEYDTVLASPPCNAFSVAGIPHHWKDHKPGPGVLPALSLVTCTFVLIARIRPRWWVVENPSGMLKTLINPPTQTVHLCNFGSRWQKRTDLWGRWPGGKLNDPWPCAEHEEAPRGSKQGTQSPLSSAERARLPYGLGEDFCKRMEAR